MNVSSAPIALTTTVLPANASDPSVVWASANNTIATVSTSGVLTAVGIGTTTITCSANDGSGTKAVSTVQVTPIMPTSISISPSGTQNIFIGSTILLTTTMLPLNTTDISNVWTSSNPAVATVDMNGVVTGTAAGIVTITANSIADFKVKASVTVYVNPIPVTSLIVTPSSINMNVGETKSLVETIAPATATDKTVMWTCNDNTIVTISASGLVTALKMGTTIITCTSAQDPNIKQEIPVTVGTVPVTSISIIPTGIQYMNISETLTLTASILPSNAVDKTVIWFSSNPAIATVNQTGIVVAVGPGTVTITAESSTNSSIYTTATIIVNGSIVPVSSLSINATNTTMNPGETQTLTASIIPMNTTNKMVLWSSSNETIATITSNGRLTAISAGTVTITCISAQDQSKIQTVNITVNTGVYIPVTSVSLDVLSLNMKVGETFSISATLMPVNASNTTVTWASSDNSIATIDNNGVVTALKSGTSTITCTSVDGSYVATCVVTIKANNTDLTTLFTQITNAEVIANSAVIGSGSGMYPQAAKEALTLAINDAKAVATNVIATQPEIDAATVSLENAIVTFNASMDVAPDKTMLNAKIIEAQNIANNAIIGTSVGNFPPSAMNDFYTAIQTAQAVANNATAIQVEVDAATVTLQIAIDVFKNSMIIAPNKTALATEISNAVSANVSAIEGTSAGNYPVGSKAMFQTAITVAQSVYDNQAATQTQIDAAVVSLKMALNVFIQSVIVDPSLSKKDLALLSGKIPLGLNDTANTYWVTKNIVGNTVSSVNLIDTSKAVISKYFSWVTATNSQFPVYEISGVTEDSKPAIKVDFINPRNTTGGSNWTAFQFEWYTKSENYPSKNLFGYDMQIDRYSKVNYTPNANVDTLYSLLVNMDKNPKITIAAKSDKKVNITMTITDVNGRTSNCIMPQHWLDGDSQWHNLEFNWNYLGANQPEVGDTSYYNWDFNVSQAIDGYNASFLSTSNGRYGKTDPFLFGRTSYEGGIALDLTKIVGIQMFFDDGSLGNADDHKIVYIKDLIVGGDGTPVRIGDYITKEQVLNQVDTANLGIKDISLSFGNLSTSSSFKDSTLVILLPPGTTSLPALSVLGNQWGSTVTITNAISINDTTRITITTIDGAKSKTYTVTYKVISNDATLKSLSINNGLLAPVFSSTSFMYNVNLPVGTTTVPTITALANNSGAKIVISNTARIPGTSTVYVTAEDGSTKTYSINFYTGRFKEISFILPRFIIFENENLNIGACVYTFNNVNIRFKIADQTIATVDNQSLLTGIKSGSTKIYAININDNTDMDSATVLVLPNIVIESATVSAGGTLLEVTVNGDFPLYSGIESDFNVTTVLKAGINYTVLHVYKKVGSPNVLLLELDKPIAANQTLTINYAPLSATTETSDVRSSFTITNATAIEETKISDVKVYPNPAETIITFEASELQIVNIFDLQGKKILSAETTNEKATIGIEELPAGLYFVQLITPSKTMRKAFVKR